MILKLSTTYKPNILLNMSEEERIKDIQNLINMLKDGVECTLNNCEIINHIKNPRFNKNKRIISLLNFELQHLSRFVAISDFYKPAEQDLQLLKDKIIVMLNKYNKKNLFTRLMNAIKF